MSNELNEYGLKCDRIPIILSIVGPGCVQIGMFGAMKSQLCGPGEFMLGNLGAGVVELLAIPDVGLDIGVEGLPKGKQTKYRKPCYQFFWNNNPKDKKPLQIKMTFKKPLQTSAAPADNIFGK